MVSSYAPDDPTLDETAGAAGNQANAAELATAFSRADPISEGIPHYTQ
jgi:hypothetical protein